jgi:3-deoxy-D-manno-octulosonic-acid transferase
LSIILYNIFLFFFKVVTHAAAFFNVKAKKWVTGRNRIFEKLEQAIPRDAKLIWVHCASLGEFEQGKPIIEKLKEQGTGHKILLTFFSPSGYEAQKNYKGADWVFYLPIDGPGNAKRFLEIVHPSLVIFVKYEFWFYYLKKIKYRKIPLLLVSALFRKDMIFFKWHGSLQRKMLSRFDHLFVQNEASKKLINEIGLSAICSVSGDTRFDRVTEIADQWKPIPAIEQFIENKKVIIAGSTWPEDEEALQKTFNAISIPDLKLIIAPHEINENHLDDLKKKFPDSIRFSQHTTHHSPLTTCLIIDNIGMLSQLYKYATITYVGGGLRKTGVHNVLEAAVYYKPVIFGEYFRKYTEATELVSSGGGLPFSDEKRNGDQLKEIIESLLHKKEEYDFRCNAAGKFVLNNKGATEKIIQFIQEKRLLTSLSNS